MSGKKDAQYHPRVFTEFYATNIRSRRPPNKFKGKRIGYFIHAHCWSLFGQVEGLGLHNIKLAKLVKVCRKYWGPKNSWWGSCSDFTGPSITVDISRDLGESQNPLMISAIQQAIDSAKTACDDLPSGLRFLPLELMVLISEYICPMTDYTVDDVQNLRNMLLGFRWELPQWFWRVRLDENLFFELGKYKDSSSLDSIRLESRIRLNLMSFVADPKKLKDSGLANRERVLRQMRDLKEAYTR